MSDLFLTHDELTDLTGFKTPRGHAKWLERNRWRFVLTRSQQARVSREYFLDRMGLPRGKTSSTDLANHGATLVEPDFSALDRM